MSYMVQCGHCITHQTPTPAPVQHGSLPEVGLPLTSLFTATRTPTGTISPSPAPTINPYITAYPTITPVWFVGPGDTPFPTFTPTITSTPAASATPSDGLHTLHLNLDLAYLDQDGGWYVTDSNVPSSFGFHADMSFVNRLTNPSGYGAQPNLGFQLRRVVHDLVFIESIQYTYHSSVRGCVSGCGNAVAWNFYDLTHEIVHNDYCYGAPCASAAYDEGVDHVLIVPVNQYVETFQSGVSLLGSSAFTPDDYIEDIYVNWRDSDAPTPTPPPTSTPTLTPTATATLTPPGYVDCRFPASGRETTALADGSSLTGGLQAISRSCFTVISPDFRLDLTGLNPAWLIAPEPLEVCIVSYRVPALTLLGQPLPLDMVLAVLVIAYFVRTLRQY